MRTDKRKFGDEGEDVAAAFLSRRGFRILARNVRISRIGEVDIICLDTRGELVFIEVKTRQGLTYGAPEEAVTRFKLRTLAACADAWRNAKGWTARPWRIDVIAIDHVSGKKEIRHLENLGLE